MKHTNKPEASKDVYQIITDRIIEELENLGEDAKTEAVGA